MRSRGKSFDQGQQHRMLRETAPPNFLNSSLEWRRIVSEIWGTFLLVVVAAGAGVVAAKSNGAVTLGMAVVAPALMVMAITYFMGTVSGPSRSGRHFCLCPTTEFSLVPRAWLYPRPGCWWYRGCSFPARHVRDKWAHSALPSGRERKRSAGASHGGAANGRLGKHNPWHRIWRPQHRNQWRHCGRRLHCACAALGRAHQRCFDEPGALLRSVGAMIAVAFEGILKGPATATGACFGS